MNNKELATELTKLAARLIEGGENEHQAWSLLDDAMSKIEDAGSLLGGGKQGPEEQLRQKLNKAVALIADVQHELNAGPGRPIRR